MHAIGAPRVRSATLFAAARDPLLLAAVATIAVVYVLRLAIGAVDEGLWKLWFLKEHGLLERAQAFLWAAALVTFALALISAARRRPVDRVALGWLAFLTALTLFAFGEEVAWGQFLIGLEPGAWMLEHNVQQDITLHNLDFGAFLGLDAGSPLTAQIATAINTAPYLLCIALWVGMPLAPRFAGSSARRLLGRLALPGEALAVFLAANVVLFLVVDKLVADVGEVFELVIAITFLLAAVETFRMQASGAAAPVLVPRMRKEAVG
jgi:hypothetical protein